MKIVSRSILVVGVLIVASTQVSAQPRTSSQVAGPNAGDDGQTVLPPVTVRPSNEPSTPALSNDSGLYDSFLNAPSSRIPLSNQYRIPSVSWNSGAINSDQQLVGPYSQPVWTTQRPFATSRVYVLPPGQAQVEQWVRPTWKAGEPVKFRMLEEFAIGLPGRFQLDIYERWNIEGEDHEANHEGVQIELRWAVADWGVIPLNPTLYAEWVERGGPQEKPNKYELKLLLADSLLTNLYYASNFIIEQETSGEKETELGWSNALSTTLIDRVLLGGVETVFTSTNVSGDRSNHDIAVLIGPSLQYRPSNRTFVDVVGLFGTTPRESSPEAQMYVVFGYQFGQRAGPANRYAGGPASSYYSGFSGGNISGPASTRGN